MAKTEDRFEIDTPKGAVSAVWTRARHAYALPDGDAIPKRSAPHPILVIAPGAGSTLDHPFLKGFTDAMSGRGVATLRFNFLYKERGRKAPDPEGTLREVWLAAFEEAASRAKGGPVFAGGKSLGGRLASMCVADGMAAAGLVFLGYPLHPPGKPERIRDEHLYRIEVPMLFIQGTKDPFAKPELLQEVLKRLGDRAELVPIEGGDHSFRRRGVSHPDGTIGAKLAEPAAEFILRVAGANG
ncbi:MAG: dienelactone hydrolase family protein [Actinomycetota bacterium]|nr:dienelactone hydrolase family protein [Actinomycetota bacterium]